jgi:hypothetical protein
MKCGKLLAAASLSLMLTSYATSGHSPNVEETSLNSPQRCNVRIAKSNLKKHILRNPITPKGDGTAPWPRLYGAWVNTERSVVVVIKGDEGYYEGRNRDVVRVRIYHLCNSSLMAEGARFIEKSDFKTEVLGIRLATVDGSMPYPYFDSYFSVVADRSGNPLYVDTQFISPMVDNHQLNDRFKLIHP